jgi:hypothetical protein
LLADICNKNLPSFKKQLRLVARRGLEYNKTVKEKHPFQGGDKT